jgi:cyclohexa-1,5-dienecarbonyl-CoA hydratase
VLIDHEGPNFCVGASVEEHLPGRAAQMLAGLHAFVRVLVGSPLYTVAAVRGFCLGGGLEVALCAGRVVAAPGAQLGAPEVKLGVFAPAASVLLPLRVGPAAAAELLCSGRVVGASEAEEFGLVDAVATDPTVAALEWFDHALAPHSAVAVRAAWGACRGTYRDAVSGPLDARERQYLDELMPHLDAQEGLAAFLDKRLPQWVHQ